MKKLLLTLTLLSMAHIEAIQVTVTNSLQNKENIQCTLMNIRTLVAQATIRYNETVTLTTSGPATRFKCCPTSTPRKCGRTWSEVKNNSTYNFYRSDTNGNPEPNGQFLTLE